MTDTKRSRGEITNEVKQLLDSIPALIEKTFPIPARFRGKLPSDIAELSRLLTNRRGDRALSYLTRPNFLSAYLYYFLPWNLYRLCVLLPTLNLKLSSGDTITDIGCGPLTFTLALWIAQPQLRNIPLEINCIDRSSPALEAGKKIFTALCNTEKEKNPWKINLIKEDIDFRKTNTARKRKQASLVCAINIFNEVYEKLSHNNTEGLRHAAANAALLMHNEALQDASILTVEPGVPQSGRFVSLLRNELIKLNRPPASPCTHKTACPFMDGPTKTVKGRNWIDTKKRWCHFAFETNNAPGELHRLSAAAKLPKARLVLSFLFTEAKESVKKGEYARVISDAFPLADNRFGRYGCSPEGLVLITGERRRIEELNSYSVVPFTSVHGANEQIDKKSGALILEAGA